MTSSQTTAQTVPVRIRRLDGSTETVQIEDQQHYLVSIFHDAVMEEDVYSREILVAAPTAPAAKKKVKADLLGASEEVTSAQKISVPDAAVLKLRGWTIHQ